MKTRRAARAAGAGAELSALPDHLLELCMPCTRDTTWPLSTLHLVCKRWKRIFDGSTRLAGGRLVLQAEYDAPSSAVTWDVAALVRLAACRTGVVQDAQVRQAHRPGRLEAVRQLTALTSLVLTAQSEQECRFHQPGQELAQRQLGLGTLPQLRRLMLDAAGLLEPSCQQLSAARHLTSLVLGDFLHEVPDALWEAAACMPALAELSISVHTPAETVVAVGSHVWQRLAACTQLARLKLAEGFVDGAPDESGAFELHPGITQLTALRRFGLHGNIASLGDLWHHTGLTRLMLLDSEQPIPAPAHRGPSLPALLEADLGADNWQMEPPQHGVISQGLCNVTRLRLRSATVWQDAFDDGAFELLEGLAQLERLQTLKLTGSLFSIPDTVWGLTSLKLLDVSKCKLRELPEGPYLLGLRTLLMPGHRMQRLPPALATARSLEVLDVMPLTTLGVPEPNMPLPLLQPGDLSALVAMPALRLLCVPLSDFPQPEGDVYPSVSVQQCLLCRVLCALLPRLVTLSYSAAQIPCLFQGGAVEGGLDPAKHAELQACLQAGWEAVTPEVRWVALEMMRGEAAQRELSAQAAALVEAFPAVPTPGKPAAAPEPS